ncbi:DUF2199 domain-containing protein [Dokdonella fugitiva]|jgi:hypothetical protein|uniref:DUF2199 domain-containing protein n=1 Tax=Dokdonella fugitiva TaxID=328517 RepID=UPI00104A3CA8|nr:DUF2199 domain-containing protein [Dokdonella fugitiva]MBA8884543.1 hypothetical protein [Dokdonella fugitiva]
MTYICETCGKEHSGWPPDIGFQRPDEVWAIPEPTRVERAQANNDLCILDGERFFIRAILYVPLSGHEESWGLGLWIEVSQDDFDVYYHLYDEDASSAEPFPGRIANALKAYPQALGAEVSVKLGTAKDRPVLTFPRDTNVDLGVAQREGLSDAALHEAIRIERPSLLSRVGG